jgi:hypothetical protein
MEVHFFRWIKAKTQSFIIHIVYFKTQENQGFQQDDLF